MPNMLYDIDIQSSTRSALGSASTIYSASVATEGCDGVLFLAVGTSGAAMKTTFIMHAQGSTASAGTFVNYGSTVAIKTTAVAGKFVIGALDVYKPTKPYIRAAIRGSTGEFPVVAIRYGMRKAGSTSYRDDAKYAGGIVLTS